MHLLTGTCTHMCNTHVQQRVSFGHNNGCADTAEATGWGGHRFSYHPTQPLHPPYTLIPDPYDQRRSSVISTLLTSIQLAPTGHEHVAGAMPVPDIGAAATSHCRTAPRGLVSTTSWALKPSYLGPCSKHCCVSCSYLQFFSAAPGWL